MDRRWNRSGPCWQSPDQDLCGRDGGTRTRDLSVPNAPGVDLGVPLRTETPGESVAATHANLCGHRGTRDGRAMGAEPKGVVFGQATSRNLRIASRMISLVVVVCSASARASIVARSSGSRTCTTSVGPGRSRDSLDWWNPLGVLFWVGPHLLGLLYRAFDESFPTTLPGSAGDGR